MVKKLALNGLASLLFIVSSGQNILANDNSNIKVVGEKQVTWVNLVSTSNNFNKSQKKYSVAVFSGHVSKGNNEYSNQGALSYTKKREFEYNDELVKEFANLNKDGIEYTLYLATEDIALSKRVALAKLNGANLYLELHHDSTENSIIYKLKKEGDSKSSWENYEGFSVFYNPNINNSKNSIEAILSRNIAEEMLKLNRKPNLSHAKFESNKRNLIDDALGIYDGSFLQVLKSQAMPTILFECGSIVSPHEEKVHSDSDFHRKIAEKIHSAVVRLKEKLKEEKE